MNVFYDLDCRGRKFAELSDCTGNDWEGILCTKIPGHQRAGKRTTPLHIDAESKSVEDFSSTILSDVVITDKALQELREAQLTGFWVEPLQIHKLPKGMTVDSGPKLWEFIVNGDGGFSHPDSGIKLKYKCDQCGLVVYSAYKHGIVVDENAYDGSDFFVVREYPKHILVSERAKVAIERSGLTNVRFLESSKLEWPKGVIKP